MNAEGVQPARPKNIVIRSDGTGNTANKNRGTNILKLHHRTGRRLGIARRCVAVLIGSG
jgi:hypothetical protein